MHEMRGAPSDLHVLLPPRRLVLSIPRSGLQTSLPRKFNFKDPEKIVELAERGGAALNLEGRQALDHAFEIGRGGVWLELTDEQYRKLKLG